MLTVYIYVNEKNNNLSIESKPKDDENDILLFSIEAGKFKEVQSLINVAILAFNAGQHINKDSKLCIGEDIGLIFLRDFDFFPFGSMFSELSDLDKEAILKYENSPDDTQELDLPKLSIN